MKTPMFEVSSLWIFLLSTSYLQTRSQSSCFAFSLGSTSTFTSITISTTTPTRSRHRQSIKMNSLSHSFVKTRPSCSILNMHLTQHNQNRQILDLSQRRMQMKAHNPRRGSTKLSSSASSSPSSTSSRKKTPASKSQSLAIVAILTATTLNLLGFTMTSPLTPSLGTHFNLPTGASFGSLTSAYPLGMLFGLFTWPKLSDVIGRKKILVTSLLGSGIGLSMQSLVIFSKAFANTATSSSRYSIFHLLNKSNNINVLHIFLYSRIFTGIFSGCGPVAKAYLADIGDQSGQLAKYLAWRDAASTLAYIVGPACGGFLFECIRQSSKLSLLLEHQQRSHALGYVIGFSALSSFIAAFLVLLLVKEQTNVMRGRSHSNSNSSSNTTTKNSSKTLEQTEDQEQKLQDTHQSKDQNSHQKDITTIHEGPDYEIISCPLGVNLWSGVATVCVVSFLYHIADSTFFAFFPALLQNTFGFNVHQIGLLFAFLSSITFCFSATSLSSKLIQRIGVVNTCSLGLGVISAGLFGLSLVGSLMAKGGGTAATAAALIGSSGMTLTLPLALVVCAATLYFSGVPLYGPTVPTMLLQCVPPYQRGTVLGIDGIINTMARIVSPIIMGDIYRRLGASVTFGLAGMAVMSSSIIAVVRRWIVLRDQEKSS
mmetsp:Transcript_17991/g.20800  ORF Transcript_17991/g.20800 Transcript_17991/m.20800 type:complete len:653 (+) Transcript_17991:222-2180(+)